jgi:hypothetical protein
MTMERSSEKKRSLRIGCACLAGVMLLQVSCGTILYPERRGQKSGRLDVAVILLDGACLLLFVIPGIVAFAVDFGTGAIYLPAEDSPRKSPETPSTGPMQQVRVAPAELTAQRLEAIVREQTGKTVHLSPGRYRAMRLQSIDQFTPQTVARLEADEDPAEVTLGDRAP